MSVSMNEVEATAKRATRGAGYPWGLAEEAAKATRWLCANDVDGIAALARMLGRGFARAPERHRPRNLNSQWSGMDILCPLATGALLSDRASTIGVRPVQIGPVAEPVLLLPFLANVAGMLGSPISMAGTGFRATTEGCQLEAQPDLPGQADQLDICSGAAMHDPRPQRSRAMPDPKDWAVLNRFAQLTYAPATEESRLLGAGAGLSDND